MAFLSIPSSWIEIGRAIRKELFDRISDDLSDLDTRVNAVETSGLNKVPLFDNIIDLENNRVGEIRWSLLSESQYKARYGNNWSTIDSQSLSGKDLDALYGPSALPAAVNRFPRILGSGLTLGQLQTSQNKEHNHGITDPSHSHNIYAGSASGSANWVDQVAQNASTNNPLPDYMSSSTTGITINNQGGTEARPDSVVLNCFIRLDDLELSRQAIIRSPADVTVVSATISNLEIGTSGSWEVDLQKGSSLGSLTTMLNSNLSIAFSAGNYATSSEASFSAASLSQNDFYVCNVEAVQSNATRFYLSSYGEAS